MDSCDSIRLKPSGIIMINKIVWLSVKYQYPCLFNMSFYKHHLLGHTSRHVTEGSTYSGVFFM